MADISIDSLKSLASTLGTDVQEALLKYVKTLEDAGKTAVSFIDISKKFGEQIAGDAVNVVNSGTEIQKLTDKIKNLTSSNNDFLVSSAYTFEPLLRIIPKTTDAFGALGKSSNAAGTSIEKTFEGTSAVIQRFFGDFSEGTLELIEGMAKGADRANSLEKNIISMASSSGDLNSVLGKNGDTFRSLEQEYNAYINNAEKVGNATGHTMNEVMTFSKEMSKVPGALRSTIAVGEELGNTMNQMEAAFKLAAAYGQDSSKVADMLSSTYLRLGTTGTKAFEGINSVFKAAQDAKIPMEIVASTVQGASDKFRLLGDNTQAATAVVRTFGKAFQEMGLGAQGTSDIISSMIGGVARMSEGQKAFVSSQTGGPGGLAGSFQMDYAIQQGNMDKVLSKTMEAMQKQFGGPILTLKEASEKPAMAGEFQKQVEYLKQVAGIAGNNQEAYRILEAMKTGAAGDLKLGKKDTTAELTQSLKRGESIQERSHTQLVNIQNAIEKTSAIQSGIQAAQLRAIIGLQPGQMRTSSGRASRSGGIGVGIPTQAGEQSVIHGQSLVSAGRKDLSEDLDAAIQIYSLKSLKAPAPPKAKSVTTGIQTSQIHSLKSSKAPQPQRMPAPPKAKSVTTGIQNLPAPATMMMPTDQEELPTPENTFTRASNIRTSKRTNEPTLNASHKGPQPLEIHLTLDIPELDKKIKKTIHAENAIYEQSHAQQTAIGRQV